MESILPTTDYKEVDGRQYLNPQVALDESNQFIENLRSTQDQQNEQITTDTRMLGTDVPTNLGGLTGAESYFTSRYQVPQTVANVANLRATAQAAALNQVLQNEQEIWKKKYQDAYRNYQKRQYNRAYGGGSGGGSNGGGGDGDGDKKLPYDVNEGDRPSTADEFKESIGTPIPLTEKSYKYRDAKTGQWFVLTSPKEIDAIAISNSVAGRNPKDGMTTQVNGKTFRYDGKTGFWYQQVYMFGQE